METMETAATVPDTEAAEVYAVVRTSGMERSFAGTATPVMSFQKCVDWISAKRLWAVYDIVNMATGKRCGFELNHDVPKEAPAAPRPKRKRKRRRKPATVTSITATVTENPSTE